VTLSRRTRRLPGLLVAAAAVALLVAAPVPAYAHDELIGSDPENGVVLDVAPEQIDLRYSAEPLAEPGSTQVRVVDPAGAEVQSGDPEVVDNGVIQAISADSAAVGTYTVTWRVVSSDGHPISGELTFSVGEESEPVAPQDDVDAPSDAILPPVATVVWIVIGLVVVALGGALVAVLTVRARRRDGDA